MMEPNDLVDEVLKVLVCRALSAKEASPIHLIVGR
jgi:hypothetical protein